MATIRISKIRIYKGGISQKPTREDIVELKSKIRHLMNDLRLKGLVDGRG